MFKAVRLENNSNIYVILNKNEVLNNKQEYITLEDFMASQIEFYGVLKVYGDKYESSYISYINISIKVLRYLNKLSNEARHNYFNID